MLKGNITNLQDFIPRSANIVSGSAQIRVDVSGSFDEGFGFGVSRARFFDGVSGSRFTPGVSGSEQFYSSSFGHPSEFGDVSGSHPSGGADYSHLLDYEAGHIRGNLISGVWSAGGSLIIARKIGSLATGVENAALVGDIRGAPSGVKASEYDGNTWTAAPDMSNNHGQAAHANSTAGATSGDGFVAGADPSGV